MAQRKRAAPTQGVDEKLIVNIQIHCDTPRFDSIGGPEFEVDWILRQLASYVLRYKLQPDGEPRQIADQNGAVVGHMTVETGPIRPASEMKPKFLN
jgi:hypothetical protein